MKYFISCLPLAVLLLSACQTTSVRKVERDPSFVTLTDKSLPAPAAGDQLAGTQPYLVGPSDVLLIDVFGIDQLSGKEIQVDAAGRMALPLAGELQVAGKTPAEVSALVTQRLRAAHVRDPQVGVNVQKAVAQTVTLEGEVREPGVYPIGGRTTLLSAIARAKGTAEFASLDDVIVFRTVAGQRYAGLYNLKGIRQGAYPDPEIYAQDVIVVGDSQARRSFRDILQIVPLLTTPLIVALQNNN